MTIVVDRTRTVADCVDDKHFKAGEPLGLLLVCSILFIHMRGGYALNSSAQPR